MNADRRVAELDVLRVALVAGYSAVDFAWRILEWDASAAVQLAALLAGTAAGTLALYELLRRMPGAGVLLGQRKRSSSRARTRAAAPAPSSAVT